LVDCLALDRLSQATGARCNGYEILRKQTAGAG
jgi:hypothetical protein